MIEAQDCFQANKPAKISPATVQQCLDLVPQTNEAWVVKVICLSDILKAQTDLRLLPSLNQQTFDQLEMQWRLAQKKATDLKVGDIKKIESKK